MPGHGAFEATLAARGVGGQVAAVARLEALARLSPTWSAFAAAEAQLTPQQLAWQVLAGLRAQW